MTQQIQCDSHQYEQEIAKGETTSKPRSLNEWAFGSISIPATDGAITCEVSVDGVTWATLTDKDGGDKADYPAGVGPRILYYEAFNFHLIRFKSTTPETADRTIHLFLKR